VELYENALGEKISVDLPPESVTDVTTTPIHRNVPQSLPPGAVDYTLEAWMPEKVAVIKLQGFLEEAGGRVVASHPGLVQVRLRLSDPAPEPAKRKGGFFATLLGKDEQPALPKKDVFLDIYMEKLDPTQPGRLTLTLVLRADNFSLSDEPGGQAFCKKVCSDICAYLMAKRI